MDVAEGIDGTRLSRPQRFRAQAHQRRREALWIPERVPKWGRGGRRVL